MANDSAFFQPWAVPLDLSKGHTIDPDDARHALGALLAPAAVNGYGHRQGVLPGGQTGSGLNNDLQVLASSGLTVNINSGCCVNVRDTSGPYIAGITGAVSRTAGTANAQSPRKDLVVFRIWEPTRDGALGTLDKTADIVIIPGTPAGNPVAPGITNRDLILAEVLVRAGATSITADDITDRRLFTTPRGGIRPRPSWDDTPGAYEGEFSDNFLNNTLDRWSGGVWEPIASPASWQSFTPGLWSSAGAVNLGSGGVARGRYQKLGKTLRVSYFFSAKSPCDLGYGPIYTRLPNGLYAAGSEGSDWHGRAQLNTQPPGGAYLQWLGDSGIFSNDNRVYAFFNKTLTDNTLSNYRVASSQGQAGTGIPQLTNAFSDPLRGFSMNIELEVQ